MSLYVRASMALPWRVHEEKPVSLDELEKLCKEE